MKKIILASASAIALLGLAACSDTDNTTTQSVTPEPAQTQPVPPATPEVTPAPPATGTPPKTDDTTTQSITPDAPKAPEMKMTPPADGNDAMDATPAPAPAPAPAE